MSLCSHCCVDYGKKELLVSKLIADLFSGHKIFVEGNLIATSHSLKETTTVVSSLRPVPIPAKGFCLSLQWWIVIPSFGVGIIQLENSWSLSQQT